MKSAKTLLILGLLISSSASLARAQTPDQRDPNQGRSAYPETRHDDGGYGWIGLLGLSGLAGLLGRRHLASDYDAVHGQVRRAP